MGFITVTNTFVNGATADATQVNQDFTDIINGTSDTTKDMSINNMTTAGTLTANGNVILGASSSKTCQFLASLSTSIPVSANTSWDFGSATLGLKSVYIGGTSTFTTRIMSAATASWTFNLPVTAGSNLQVLQTDGSGNTSWATVYTDPTAKQNYGVSTSVNASALTINLLGSNGSNPSASNPVNINFRNATSATGTPVFVQVTAATSLVIPSTATLGTQNGLQAYIYVYALNNAGTVELAASYSNEFDEGSIQNTTNVAGASNSPGVLYSTSGRTGVAIRMLARLSLTEATAGTWATNSSEIACGTFSSQTGYYSGYHANGNSWSTTSATFVDPTNSGGATLTKRAGNILVTTAASNNPGITFTPASASAVYQISAVCTAFNGTAADDVVLQLTDGTAVLCIVNSHTNGGITNIPVPHAMTGMYAPGVNTAVTLKIQAAAPNGGTTSIAPQGGTLSSSIEWTILRII